MTRRDRAGLLLVGWLLGLGTPFFIAGAALQLSGSVMRVEIVKDK